MRNARAAIIPVLLLAALIALSCFELQFDRLANFPFIWDVLLGAAAGIGLSMLPQLSGFSQKKNAATSMYWICGFAALMVIFYQYITSVTGMGFPPVAFLSSAGPRMRIIEGVVLGYCSTVAGRGKV